MPTSSDRFHDESIMENDVWRLLRDLRRSLCDFQMDL